MKYIKLENDPICHDELYKSSEVYILLSFPGINRYWRRIGRAVAKSVQGTDGGVIPRNISTERAELKFLLKEIEHYTRIVQDWFYSALHIRLWVLKANYATRYEKVRLGRDTQFIDREDHKKLTMVLDAVKFLRSTAVVYYAAAFRSVDHACFCFWRWLRFLTAAFKKVMCLPCAMSKMIPCCKYVYNHRDCPICVKAFATYDTWQFHMMVKHLLPWMKKHQAERRKAKPMCRSKALHTDAYRAIKKKKQADNHRAPYVTVHPGSRRRTVGTVCSTTGVWNLHPKPSRMNKVNKPSPATCLTPRQSTPSKRNATRLKHLQTESLQRLKRDSLKQLQATS